MLTKQFLFAAVFSIFLATNVFAQENLNIKGRVMDANNAAVAGATVFLSRRDVRFERESVTNENGDFSFENLAKGNYQITATAKNFASAEKKLELSQSGEVRLILQPAPIAEQISVTSSYLAGTPDSLSEIPGAIERITPQRLENSRVFNFSEALRKVSGVNVRDEEGFGLRPNIGIRGTNPTRSTKVLLLEDGLPLSYAPYGDNASYYHPPVERYESIEILKGSGQIAYGPQTLAGVVNYITPNPPEKPTFTFKLEGGNRRFFDGSAGFGTTFGKLGLIANYTRKQGAGARDNTFSMLNDLATKLTYNLTDRNALTAKFTAYREDSNVTYSGLTEAEFAANPRQNPFKNDRFYGRRYGFALQHAAVLTSKISLTTNFYSNYFSRDWWRQSSNSGERPNRLRTLAGGDADCFGMQDLYTTCGNQGRLRNYLTVGFEPRLNVHFDLGSVRNELTAGIRVHWEKQKRRQENGDLPTSRSGVLAESNIRKNLAYSGFLQNRFIFGNFAVTPGIRIEKIEFQRQNLLGAGALGKTDLTEIVPGIGVAYSGLKNTTIFAGVHRGFAPPRTEDIISNTGGVIDLNAELSWNYEIGVRTRPMRGVEIVSAFFRNDYENQIVPASIAGGIGAAFTNGGQTLQQGFELAGQIDSGAIFRSPHNFYLRTAVTYLTVADFRGTRFSTINNQLLCPTTFAAGRGCVVSGNRLPYAPKTNITSSFGYSHTIGIDAFVENVFIGRQFGDDLNLTTNPLSNNNGQLGVIPAQTCWNATANYKVEKWKTTFFVTAKNIFDRTFIVDRTRGILPSSPRLIQTGVMIKF